VRFLTSAWHSGELTDEDEEAAVESYRKHLAVLRPRISAAVEQLAFSIDLHDALLEEVVLNCGDRVIVVRMICGDVQLGYSTLQLAYRGVRWSDDDIAAIRTIVADPAAEVLCDEVDVVPGELYEHRVLFWPYREMTVAFEALEISSAPRQGRHRPHAPRLVEE